jgi:hypothetical protein
VPTPTEPGAGPLLGSYFRDRRFTGGIRQRCMRPAWTNVRVARHSARTRRRECISNHPAVAREITKDCAGLRTPAFVHIDQIKRSRWWAGDNRELWIQGVVERVLFSEVRDVKEFVGRQRRQ